MHHFKNKNQRSDRSSVDENDIQIIEKNLLITTNNIRLVDKFMFQVQVSNIYCRIFLWMELLLNQCFLLKSIISL